MKNKLSTLVLLMILFSAISCKAQIARNGERENDASRAGSVNAVRNINTRRAAHTATPLDNGKVLIAGGFAGDENTLASAEIFDPKTNEFSPAGRMNASRAGHTATLLPGGKVLIAGGYNGDYLASAEIYDSKTGEFTPIGKMTVPRNGQTAVRLDNGKILLAGGVGTGWTFSIRRQTLSRLRTEILRRRGSLRRRRFCEAVRF